MVPIWREGKLIPVFFQKYFPPVVRICICKLHAHRIFKFSAGHLQIFCCSIFDYASGLLVPRIMLSQGIPSSSETPELKTVTFADFALTSTEVILKTPK